MSRLNAFWSFLGHYKYPIVIILGFLFVGILDENSVVKRVKLEMKIDDLKDEIQKYREQDDNDKMKLRDLKRNPGAMEKIARERYFMKKDDEDIYVLSDEEYDSQQANQTNTDETTE
jgi:cell division protein FtsB